MLRYAIPPHPKSPPPPPVKAPHPSKRGGVGRRPRLPYEIGPAPKKLENTCVVGMHQCTHESMHGHIEYACMWTTQGSYWLVPCCSFSRPQLLCNNRNPRVRFLHNIARISPHGIVPQTDHASSYGPAAAAVTVCIAGVTISTLSAVGGVTLVVVKHILLNSGTVRSNRKHTNGTCCCPLVNSHLRLMAYGFGNVPKKLKDSTHTCFLLMKHKNRIFGVY